MYLTKLTLDPRAGTYRRDAADVHDMHRTVMSGYPAAEDSAEYRRTHAVLWRLDATPGRVLQYVQSRTEPDWSSLPYGHLLTPAEVRPLDTVFDAVSGGRKFAFRLVANPTRWALPTPEATRRRRLPLRKPHEQIDWLVGKGEQHGFVIPSGGGGAPDVTATALPRLIGKRNQQDKITIDAVRFDGHLVVTDPAAFTEALVMGIGRAKSYGCGLLSLAAARARQPR